MTERLHFHFSLPCIGEGNGNPLQCSCLENPRDGGAWCRLWGRIESDTTDVTAAAADSVLKSRDITLPTKVHIVKTMLFPVVMYGYGSRTLKKAECQRIDAFKLWC